MDRQFDTSYIGPYLHDWIKYIRESTKLEQQVIEGAEEFRVPYAGAQPVMIELLFKISDRFKIDPHAKHLAVHMLDRYLNQRFLNFINCCGELTQSTMRQIQDKMSSGLKLDLATCLMIASKIDLFKTGLIISQIQEMMQLIDPSRNYSKQSVIHSEIRILRTLNFRIQFCLPIHAVEIFLAYAELVPKMQVRDTCFQLLDIAYLRHDDLFSQLHLLARGKKFDKSSIECRDFLALESDYLFIAAAVVICGCFFFQLKKKTVESLTAKLAKLVQIGAIDVNIMANILFTFALDEEDFQKIVAGGNSS